MRFQRLSERVEGKSRPPESRWKVVPKCFVPVANIAGSWKHQTFFIAYSNTRITCFNQHNLWQKFRCISSTCELHFWCLQLPQLHNVMLLQAVLFVLTGNWCSCVTDRGDFCWKTWSSAWIKLCIVLTSNTHKHYTVYSSQFPGEPILVSSLFEFLPYSKHASRTFKSVSSHLLTEYWWILYFPLLLILLRRIRFLS